MDNNDNKTGIALVVRFAGGGELAIREYSTIDINRQGKDIFINITSATGGFELNSIYDEILELLGENEAFDITIEKEGGAAAFGDIAVTYHVNAEREVLSFSRKVKQIVEEKRDESME